MVYTATDKEQIDEIKKWWNDYGKAITVAVVVGLVIGFGWRYWNRYRAAEDNSASYMYQAQLQAAAHKQAGPVLAYAQQIRTKFGGTVYATMASFMAARVAVANKKYSDASTNLSWIIQKSSNPSFKQIARIRNARILVQMKEPALAMKVISTVDDKKYQPMIDSVKGEIYTAQGDAKAAEKAFKQAKSAYQAAGIQNPFIQLRLSS